MLTLQDFVWHFAPNIASSIDLRRHRGPSIKQIFESKFRFCVPGSRCPVFSSSVPVAHGAMACNCTGLYLHYGTLQLALAARIILRCATPAGTQTSLRLMDIFPDVIERFNACHPAACRRQRDHRSFKDVCLEIVLCRRNLSAFCPQGLSTLGNFVRASISVFISTACSSTK